MARDPELTRAEVARRMHVHQADLDRQLGYTAGKDRRAQQRVGIPAASRLTLARARPPRTRGLLTRTGVGLTSSRRATAGHAHAGVGSGR